MSRAAVAETVEDASPVPSVGSFVRLPGGSKGRVVARVPGTFSLVYLVKLDNGSFLRCTVGQLRSR